MFINNFADFGLFLTFADYCRKRGILISELDPKVPGANKKLDFLIKIKERGILVEALSPIDSTLRGRGLKFIITQKIKDKEIPASPEYPLIFLINLRDFSW